MEHYNSSNNDNNNIIEKNNCFYEINSDEETTNNEEDEINQEEKRDCLNCDILYCHISSIIDDDDINKNKRVFICILILKRIIEHFFRFKTLKNIDVHHKETFKNDKYKEIMNIYRKKHNSEINRENLEDIFKSDNDNNKINIIHVNEAQNPFFHVSVPVDNNLIKNINLFQKEQKPQYVLVYGPDPSDWNCFLITHECMYGTIDYHDADCDEDDILITNSLYLIFHQSMPLLETIERYRLEARKRKRDDSKLDDLCAEALVKDDFTEEQISSILDRYREHKEKIIEVE